MHSMITSLLLLLFVPPATAAPESDAEALEASAVSYEASSSRDDALGEVDRLLEFGKYEQAIDRLEDLVEDHPRDVEFAWRHGKAYVDIGEVKAEVGTEEETKRAYERGVELLREARELDPDNRDATFNLAIAIGRYSLMGGNRAKVEGSREVKELAEKTIEIDPDYDGAYHLLGRWHREVADLGFFTKALVEIVYGGFPDASLEQALANYEKAYSIRPIMAHRLEMGIVLDMMGREDEAEAIFEEVLKMESDHVDAWLMRAEAKRRLDS